MEPMEILYNTFINSTCDLTLGNTSTVTVLSKVAELGAAMVNSLPDYL